MNPALGHQDLASPYATPRRFGFAVATAVLLVAAWTLLITAWVCDDAYISFRVVDNVVNGYGLRWNVAERVQTFSNPLWVLLLTAPYALTGEIYYTSLAVSALLSLATLWVVMRRCATSIGAGALIALALVLSPTFVAFSTSGLENPLTHLLVALFCAAYFVNDSPPQRKGFVLSLLASLCAINRLDSALLLGIPLVWFVLQHRTRPVVLSFVAGTLPLMAWEAFAIAYYGMPIPNTAYAKLATGIPVADLVEQGLSYFPASAQFDPMGAGMIVLGVLVVPMIDRRSLPLSIAIAAQCVYVLRVGGDFMAGRFFSASIVVAAALLAASLSRLESGTRRQAIMVLSLGMAAAATSTAQATIASSRSYTPGGFEIPLTGIVDERKYYYWATGLLSSHRTTPISHPFATEGMKLRESGEGVAVAGVMGFLGYFAGPGAHVVDVYALCDPLLARLPALQPWRIGHFERKVPDGYRETLESGRNRISDPRIAQVYDILHTVTRDPLFGEGRVRAVVALNSGAVGTIARQSVYAATIACRNSGGSDTAACDRANAQR